MYAHQEAWAVPSELDTARTFLTSCSATKPTPAVLSLVDRLADGLRTALHADDLTPLRETVRQARTREYELHDAFAAAQQCLTDELFEGPIAVLHATYRRMLDIAHAVLPRAALAH
ncbi:MAG: hypothetical protein ABR975_07715 [Vulcanimicrobiaceae bacterium]|jgi:hypothetical protein